MVWVESVMGRSVAEGGGVTTVVVEGVSALRGVGVEALRAGWMGLVLAATVGVVMIEVVAGGVRAVSMEEVWEAGMGVVAAG